jgi:AcrR family transcriptional regulator
MGSLERREREREEIRGRILDAARRLFAAEGYDAVSMRKIAEAIEYSPTAIYAHFRDKESLVEELCRCDFSALGEGFSRLSGIADPVERIRALGRAYIMFAVEHPQHFRFMFMTPMAAKPAAGVTKPTAGEAKPSAGEAKPAAGEAKPSAGAAEDRDNPDMSAYAILVETVREAIGAGRFAAGFKDADFLAQVLWSSVHGLAALRVAKSEDEWVHWRPLKGLLEVVPDAALRGLLAAGDPMLAKLAPMADGGGAAEAIQSVANKSEPNKSEPNKSGAIMSRASKSGAGSADSDLDSAAGTRGKPGRSKAGGAKSSGAKSGGARSSGAKSSGAGAGGAGRKTSHRKQVRR